MSTNHRPSLFSIAERLAREGQIGKSQRQAFIESIQAYKLPTNATCLSVSVGDGVWDYVALQNFKSISKMVATDVVDCPVSDTDKESLKKLGNWEFKKIEAEKSFPFPDSSFDLIFHQDVIEHVSKPYFFIAEQFRMLKPGGCLVCGTPNLLRPMNMLKLFLGKLHFPLKLGSKEQIGDYVHIQEFTQWQLTNLFEEVGFSNLNVRHCYFGFHLINLQFSAAPKSSIGQGLSHFLMLSCQKPLTSSR
jgi:ubiquinone/menaquinone biosynthesis C-methylase UbiE